MKRAEAAIQREMVRWIPIYWQEMKFSFKVKIIAAMNEDSRHNLSMGVDVGLTDLILLCRPRTTLQLLFLELKIKDGKLQKSQKEWNEEFDSNYASDNAMRTIAYGYSDGKKAVDNWIRTIYHNK